MDTIYSSASIICPLEKASVYHVMIPLSFFQSVFTTFSDQLAEVPPQNSDLPMPRV